MPKKPRSRSVAFVADVASLPTSGSNGDERIVLDDGTGKAAHYIWDNGTSSYILSIGGFSPFAFKGNWNATTNIPALASGVGNQGDVYFVSVAGATNLDGITDWQIGDYAAFNGTVWQKWDNTDLVTSVDSLTGAVDLTGRYYLQTVLDAAPVAAGAKIDKIIGTDHAIVRSDGIVGGVQDSPKVTIDDAGNIFIQGDATFKDAVIALLCQPTANALIGMGSTAAPAVTELLLGFFEAAAKAVIQTAAKTGADSSIPLELSTGSTVSADSGPISHITGDSTNNNSGGLLFKTGAAGATRGDVFFDGKLAILKLGNKDGSTFVSIRDSDGSQVAFITDLGQVHGIDVTSDNISATETQPGSTEIATQAETDTGTNDDRYITPLKHLNAPPHHLTIVNKAATFTPVHAEDVYHCDAVGGAISVNAPPSSALIAGHVWTILRTNSGANKVTIFPNGIETISGGASVALNAQWTSIDFYSDGSNLFVK